MERHGRAGRARDQRRACRADRYVAAIVRARLIGLGGIPLGAFVWTNFPFGQPPEARSKPGPISHIGYHLGTQGSLILLAYTSSSAWRGGGLGVPAGVVTFDAAEAGRLNQKAFHLDLRTLAYVALTLAWFPRLAEVDRGIVAVASKAEQLRIIEAGRALAGRRETVEIRGIGSGATVTTRRQRE